MEKQKVKGGLALLLMVALSLAACMPIRPEGSLTNLGTPTPVAEATVAPTEEASGEATVEPTKEPMEEPTQTPTEETAGETANTGDAVASSVSQTLAQQLQISADQIEIVSVENVDWPDACLGVYTADMMCAQVITPGYRVVLAADGQQYEYHTNSDGSFVQLFSAPEANVGDVLITWQQTLDTCQSAQIGTGGIAYGPCMGVQMGAQFVEAARSSELEDLVATYAPFEAETPAGSVTFNGQGSTAATPAEQRMIAEWARLAVQEVSAGRSSAALGLAFAWHREGGIAGFCDDLAVYVTGQLSATSCKNQDAANLGQRRISADELAQLYQWIDEYAPFEYNHDDGAVADSMQVTLIFSGTGSTEADEATKQAILAFAQDLYGGMSQ
jgi:hypothetical protein